MIAFSGPKDQAPGYCKSPDLVAWFGLLVLAAAWTPSLTLGSSMGPSAAFPLGTNS